MTKEECPRCGIIFNYDKEKKKYKKKIFCPGCGLVIKIPLNKKHKDSQLSAVTFRFILRKYIKVFQFNLNSY